MEKKKVAVGLSGGVDSSLSAALLIEQGYEVTGVFLECWRAPGCRVDEDRKDALDVALGLGIPYQVLDFKQAYKDRVVEYFYREYEAGRTPNPDTMCNREIKFGMFYDWALRQAQGKPTFDYVATGHYARVTQRHDDTVAQRHELVRGADPKKDQSYFLYQLRPEQLAHILFPIGHLTKAEVRAEAEKRNLKTATKPDSQGICFIGEVNVTNFLKERISEKSGDVVIKLTDEAVEKLKSQKLKFKTTTQRAKVIDNQYLVIGTHSGIPFYTIGQKVGQELDRKWLARLHEEGLVNLDPQNMPSLFVIEKDVDKNILVVGKESETFSNSFSIIESNWLDQDFSDKETFEAYVRIRHGGELVKALFTKKENKLEVTLDQPIKGIAQGQAAVIYSSDKIDAKIIGGGIIK